MADFKTAESLAKELIDRGCLADQLVFLIDGVPVLDKRVHAAHSLYRLQEVESLSVWRGERAGIL